MRTLPLAVVLLPTLLLPSSATAQPAMFAGYDQFCGIPVIVRHNPQSATAERDLYGNPTIHVDPGVMKDWTMSRVFTLAHECGHHRLGHTTRGGRYVRNTQFWATRVQELEADCWAARALAANGYAYDLRRSYIDFAYKGGFRPGNYPSGLERADTVARCSYTGSNVDPLNRPQWTYTDLPGDPSVMAADLESHEYGDSSPPTLRVLCARFADRPPSGIMFIHSWGSQVRFSRDVRVEYRLSSGAERSEIWRRRSNRDIVQPTDMRSFVREVIYGQSLLDIRVYPTNGALRAVFDLRGARAALAPIADMCGTALR